MTCGELFLKQNRKCALTGQSIFFAKTTREHDSKQTTASLDRIDSNNGYIEGNVQWVHKKLNMMKQAMPDQEFIQ